MTEEDRTAAVDEEARRLRRLRTVVDLTANVLAQGRLERGEAEALVAAARRNVLDLFPEKAATYELILAPRFARLLDEFAPAEPRRVLPFPPRIDMRRPKWIRSPLVTRGLPPPEPPDPKTQRPK